MMPCTSFEWTIAGCAGFAEKKIVDLGKHSEIAQTPNIAKKIVHPLEKDSLNWVRLTASRGHFPISHDSLNPDTPS